MEFNDLTEGQKAKFRACETTEEMIAVAEEEAFELAVVQLDELSGGRSGFGFCNYHEGYRDGRRF